jgi:uncharacterized protein YcfL
MKSGTKVLIAYLIMQFLTVGCSSGEPLTYAQWQHQRMIFDSLQQNGENLVKNAEAFDRIGREPTTQKPTVCQPFGRGFICN